ncbi:uncharacterized protein LOC143846691 [Tasmannia lanceolata]|uniref:uncharacterized protein LOC143846691 n=1 Tax=Tasmannia lanceolata TaxID=3420 RepID=UPI004064B1AC
MRAKLTPRRVSPSLFSLFPPSETLDPIPTETLAPISTETLIQSQIPTGIPIQTQIPTETLTQSQIQTLTTKTLTQSQIQTQTPPFSTSKSPTRTRPSLIRKAKLLPPPPPILSPPPLLPPTLASSPFSIVHTPTFSKGRPRQYVKVNGRTPRVRLPVHAAAHIFHLTRELGHRSEGQTIEWLLRQAEPIISTTSPASASAPPGPAPRRGRRKKNSYEQQNLRHLSVSSGKNRRKRANLSQEALEETDPSLIKVAEIDQYMDALDETDPSITFKGSEIDQFKKNSQENLEGINPSVQLENAEIGQLEKKRKHHAISLENNIVASEEEILNTSFQASANPVDVTGLSPLDRINYLISTLHESILNQPSSDETPPMQNLVTSDITQTKDTLLAVKDACAKGLSHLASLEHQTRLRGLLDVLLAQPGESPTRSANFEKFKDRFDQIISEFEAFQKEVTEISDFFSNAKMVQDSLEFKEKKVTQLRLVDKGCTDTLLFVKDAKMKAQRRLEELQREIHLLHRREEEIKKNRMTNLEEMRNLLAVMEKDAKILKSHQEDEGKWKMEEEQVMGTLRRINQEWEDSLKLLD